MKQDQELSKRNIFNVIMESIYLIMGVALIVLKFIIQKKQMLPIL